MSKIKLQDLITVLNSDVVKYNSCIEMNFCIDDDTEYKDCWLGKMPDKNGKELYWYGLVPDGLQAYDYTELEDMLNAKVFREKSLCDVIERITWYSLDGCSIEKRLPDYINDYENSLKRSAPIPKKRKKNIFDVLKNKNDK
ncbi:hypothetical protein SH1V18_08050 [Vallitalea longa]|uniref:Uncharacterized protein n=1 Tax=Vallitalea longa TaxID=2936439 RepID=A0A9W5Y961_9FIRM|nr:hypothetical protein [Vallitalea longa]GKX28325.1 hypothetical protein SH1V18_08050 [Vallitalea longa]